MFCFQGMVEKAFGSPGYYILSFIQFIYPFICKYADISIMYPDTM